MDQQQLQTMDQQLQTMDQQQQLPPGFRFYPTEQELITFYLHNKLHSQGPDLHLAIPSIDIYSYDPPQLPGLAGRLCHREIEQWFFFVPQQEREARGGRPNRTTASGYWKATGSPSCVYSSSENKVIGVKKTMVFYQGRAPTGTKTKWKMNEYKAALKQQDTLMNNIDPSNSSSSSTPFPKVRNELSLCRVYVTSGCARAFDRRPPPGFVARIHNNTSRTVTTTNFNQDGNCGNTTNQEQEGNGPNSSQNVDGTSNAVLMEGSNSSSDSSKSNKSGGNDQMTLQDQEDQDPATLGSCINSHEIEMAEDLDSLWDLENFLL